MNSRQTLVVMQMLRDPRLPLAESEIFSGAILDAVPGDPLELSEERLETLSRYLPDLVGQYRQAGSG